MRVSRLVILGLSGLVALHIFMLAGHGHGPDPFAGMRVVTVHAPDGVSASLAAATDEDESGTGMQMEMTITCLAVVAGLLLLQPQQRRQTIPSHRDERGPAWYPARSTPGRVRTRSLEDLCISLT